MAAFGLHNATFRRAWCNGQGHRRDTHAASGQLHRGLLWQRLTCIPGMLGRILEDLDQSFCFARGVTDGSNVMYRFPGIVLLCDIRPALYNSPN